MCGCCDTGAGDLGTAVTPVGSTAGLISMRVNSPGSGAGGGASEDWFFSGFVETRVTGGKDFGSGAESTAGGGCGASAPRSICVNSPGACAGFAGVEAVSGRRVTSGSALDAGAAKIPDASPKGWPLSELLFSGARNMRVNSPGSEALGGAAGCGIGGM